MPACLYILLFCLLTPVRLQKGLVINEILYAPEDSQLEFIEVLNTSEITIDLCSYLFSDNRAAPVSICEGTHLLSPGSLAVIARNGDLLSSYFPGYSFITPSSWPALNNGGDAVRLFLGGQLIDEVVYEASSAPGGYSLERIDPNTPSWASSNWAGSIAQLRATPGQQNSIFQPDLQAPSIQMAEVEPPFHIYIVFNEPIDTTLLAASDFRVDHSLPQTLTLLTDSTARLGFRDPVDGLLINSRNLLDVAGNRSAPASFPLSYLPESGSLVINEIMFEPLHDAYDALVNQPEYVELLNVSNKNLSLRQLRLTGPEDENGAADTIQAEAQYPVLAPAQFAVLYAHTANRGLETAFPSLLRQTSPALLPVSASSLGLRNAGDFLRINQLNIPIDELTYDPTWHYIDYLTTRGISLERRSPEAASADPTNWSSSTHPEGGTPGRMNSIQVTHDTGLSSGSVDIEPTPFTPDGDGTDDVLTVMIKLDTAPQSTTIRIFDSKGRQVHTLVHAAAIGTESIFLWDGKGLGGKDLPTGIYIFLVELHDFLGNKAKTIKKIAVLSRL